MGVMASASNGRRFGECRRDSPHAEGWPVTTSDEWCGQFRLSQAAKGSLGLRLTALCVSGLALLSFAAGLVQFWIQL
jgi:hypothetical protein